MGKDDKEDSGFGFKDKAKAEDTLRLLEEHPLNYRRLTVRGLLGRAKRVLSMTKAEDKIKNIKEAMAVFEGWLADLDKNKEQKTEKKPEKKREEKTKEKEDKNGDDQDSSDSASDVSMEEAPKEKKKELPADTVPGLGFKDKEAADGTLRELEGRDPDYQKLAVKGLIGRAKRVLTCTRDETKLSNIKEAIAIFEQFLDDFDSQHLSRQNNAYLSLGLVRTAEKTAESVSDQQKCFIAAYASVNGEYKRLRTVPESDGGKTWDIVRNAQLKLLKEKHADAKLFNENDQPTPEHLEMMLWAYSPEPAKVKKCVKETKEQKEDGDCKKDESESKREDRKRRSSGKDEESSSKKRKE